MQDMPETNNVPAPLPGPPGQDARSRPDTADIVAVWRAISNRLVPIFGERGVAALYRRSLSMVRTDFPCLNALHSSGQFDCAALQAVLQQQSDADAVAANDALLHHFYALLAPLIGESLTERMLRSILDIHSSGAAAQKAGNDPE